MRACHLRKLWAYNFVALADEGERLTLNFVALPGGKVNFQLGGVCSPLARWAVSFSEFLVQDIVMALAPNMNKSTAVVVAFMIPSPRF
jgi:hypothetical protein